MPKSCLPAFALLRRITLGGAAAVFVLACASSSQHSAGATPTASRSSRYVLTAGDIADASAQTLYDAVLKLRPEFIRGRGEFTRVSPDAPAATPVIVYRDGARIGGVDELRQILPSQVAEVRYLPGPEAAVKFGTNHGGGVILITSKPRP